MTYMTTDELKRMRPEIAASSLKTGGRLHDPLGASTLSVQLVSLYYLRLITTCNAHTKRNHTDPRFAHNESLQLLILISTPACDITH
jgi:hypothetical protein